MINTILFDLDGTLLPMNTELFLNSYFKALSSKCAHLIEPKELSTMVLASTECMIRNIDITKTNEQIFMEDFSTRINIDLNNLLPVFDDFYKNDFKHLQSTVQPTAVIKDVIEILKEKGYTMVVATNPLFPREAILQRIQWSGLQESDFALITDYQCMHFCKPNLQYYEEILKLIDKTPGECMMVGNDVQEDLVVEKIGMKTFLIEDNMINRENREFNPDYKGSYQELLEFVKTLPFL